MATLKELIERYSTALDEKDRLESLTKENNRTIKALRDEVALAMVDEDTPKIEKGGYTYSLTPKTRYAKRSEAAIEEAGLDFFDVLRSEGLGGIIKETVNAQTLQSAITAYVDENEALSDELEQCISSYEYNDVTRRKASTLTKKGAKK